VRPLEPERDGVLARVDAEAIGRASTDLGAGRHRKGDPIDHAVGIVFRRKTGDRIERGSPIGEIHARDEDTATTCAVRVLAALTLADERVEPPPLVYGWYGG
jgi:thymidine phosphorylase